MMTAIENLPTAAYGSFRATLPIFDVSEAEFPARPIPADVRFALVWNPHYLPYAFPHLEDLARSIHRRRQGAAIELFSTTIAVVGRPQRVRVVKITKLHEGMGQRLIGFAYLGGHRQSQRDLREALNEFPLRRGGASS